MSGFPEALRLSLGRRIDDLVDWLLVNYGAFFDAVSGGVLFLLLKVERALLWIPWWAAVLAVAVLGWRSTRRLWLGIVLGLLLVLIGTFSLWDLAMRTLAIVGTAVVLSVCLGIPLGIVMARSGPARSIMQPVLDAMQTMPSFVYLIPALMFFGLGKVPGVMATVVYAVPPVIRLTDLGIRQVSAHVVEAARAFGSTSRQLLLEVQIPLALPAIMAGINQTTMMALAMVVIASMIGARGLGEEVLVSIQRIEVGRGFEAGLSIVAMAIIIDRITQGLAQRLRYPRTG